MEFQRPRRCPRQSPLEKARIACEKKVDQGGFSLKFISDYIGWGVFCEKEFSNGDFLLEYQGDLISGKEGEKREKSYPESKGSFLYFFQHRGSDKCIDGTSSGGFGRMVNDSERHANCKMRVVEVEGVPKLCLFASRQITCGSELRFDYGVKNLPWRLLERKQTSTETTMVGESSSRELREQEQEQTPTEKTVVGESSSGELEQEQEQTSTETTMVGESSSRELEQEQTSTEAAVVGESSSRELEQEQTSTETTMVVESSSRELEQEQTSTQTTVVVESSSRELAGRWADSIRVLKGNRKGCRHVQHDLIFSKECKIANGSDGAQIFVGLYKENPVAVKRVTRELIQNEQKISLLLKSKCHVLPLLHYKEDDDFAYLTTPLCEYNLQELIENESCTMRDMLTHEERIRLCIELLCGVKELHDEGIMHRDLKPSNILLDSTCKLYITDFGISRQLFGQTTVVTSAVGTLCWMAHEAFGGKNMGYKKSTDIQVAGSLLYYILTDGHSPYETAFPYTVAPEGILRNRQSNSFTLKHLADYPDLCDIVEKMLHSKPVQRPTVEYCIKRFRDHSSLDVRAESVLLSIISGKGFCEDSADSPDDTNGIQKPKHDEPSSSQSTLCSIYPETIMKTTVHRDSDSTFSTDQAEESRGEHIDYDGDSITENLMEAKFSKKRKVTPLQLHIESDDSSTDSGGNESGTSTTSSSDLSEDETPFVVTSSTKPSSSRVWDRYHYCLFCGTKEKKLLRHLRRCHEDEVKVAEAIAAEEGGNNSQATLIWTQIKNLGNHDHNKLVVKGEAKDFIVRKRPKYGLSTDLNKFVPCSDCFGYFHIDTLWLHRKTCRARDLKDCNQKHVKTGRCLLPLKHDVEEPFRKILDQMVLDAITLIIKGDKDILAVGQNLLEKSTSFQKGEMSRERMRVLAKVLQSAREIDCEIKTAADLVKPGSFDTVVLATRKLSGYDEVTQKHSTYSNALRVNYALKDLALSIRSDALKSNLEKKVKQVDNFLKLRESEWNIKISASALRQRNELNWRKPQLLPLTEDCVKFNKFLEENVTAVKAAIAEKGMTSSTCQQLSSATLTQVVLFNRRRPREVEMLEVKDYQEQMANKRAVHDEVEQALSVAEKLVMDRLSLLMVRGKRGRGVPVVLTESTKESIDMIIDFNKKGRDTLPKYVFARQQDDATTPMRAGDAIRELTSQASLKYPENLRSTKLRKHIATLSQLLNLKESELEQLANHMGHDISIHREYYRLPQPTLLLAKMSKLLTLTEKGEVHKHCGESLDEIHLDNNDLDDLDSDSDSGSDSEPPRQESRDSDVLTVEPKKGLKTKNAFRYNRWSQEQEKFLLQQPEIINARKTQTAPGKMVGLLIIQRSKGLLSDKTWVDIKNKIHNMNRQEKINMQQKEKLTTKGRKY